MTGVSAMPRFRIGLAAFQARILGATAPVIRRRLQLVHDLLDHAVLDRLVVRRQAAGALRAGVLVVVEVGAPDGERIEAQGTRDLVDHPFHAQRALRAAEAAEGGVGLRVGLAPVGGDASRGQVIGVVGVQHRPVGHGEREIGRHAAARRLLEFDAEDAALVVEADAIVDAEVVPLARDRHVVVAVVAALGRAAGQPGHQGRHRRRQVALALLAAEAAAHAARLDRHGVARHAQHVRHLVLDLGRVLGGGMDGHVVVLARHRQRHVAFEVEVLLPAHRDAACQRVRCGGNGRDGVAARHGERRLQQQPGLHRRVDGEAGGLVLVLHDRQAGGRAGLGDRLGRDGEQRLAPVLDQPVGEHRIVPGDRAHVVDARHVPGGQHDGHAGRAPHLRYIERPDATACARSLMAMYM